jgi:hypothetical protein
MEISSSSAHDDCFDFVQGLNLPYVFFFKDFSKNCAMSYLLCFYGFSAKKICIR